MTLRSMPTQSLSPVLSYQPPARWLPTARLLRITAWYGFSIPFLLATWLYWDGLRWLQQTHDYRAPEQMDRATLIGLCAAAYFFAMRIAASRLSRQNSRYSFIFILMHVLYTLAVLMAAGAFVLWEMIMTYGDETPPRDIVRLNMSQAGGAGLFALSFVILSVFALYHYAACCTLRGHE